MINNPNIPIGNLENYWNNFDPKKPKNAWGWKKPAPSPKGIKKDIKKDKKE